MDAVFIALHNNFMLKKILKKHASDRVFILNETSLAKLKLNHSNLMDLVDLNAGDQLSENALIALVNQELNQTINIDHINLSNVIVYMDFNYGASGTSSDTSKIKRIVRQIEANSFIKLKAISQEFIENIAKDENDFVLAQEISNEFDNNTRIPLIMVLTGSGLGATLEPRINALRAVSSPDYDIMTFLNSKRTPTPKLQHSPSDQLKSAIAQFPKLDTTPELIRCASAQTVPLAKEEMVRASSDNVQAADLQAMKTELLRHTSLTSSTYSPSPSPSTSYGSSGSLSILDSDEATSTSSSSNLDNSSTAFRFQDQHYTLSGFPLMEASLSEITPLINPSEQGSDEEKSSLSELSDLEIHSSLIDLARDNSGTSESGNSFSGSLVSTESLSNLDREDFSLEKASLSNSNSVLEKTPTSFKFENEYCGLDGYTHSDNLLSDGFVSYKDFVSAEPIIIHSPKANSAPLTPTLAQPRPIRYIPRSSSFEFTFFAVEKKLEDTKSKSLPCTPSTSFRKFN